MKSVSLTPSTMSGEGESRIGPRSPPPAKSPPPTGGELMAQAQQSMFGAGPGSAAAGAAPEGASFDTSSFFQLPPEIFDSNLVEDYDTNVASMDWTSWNEFVFDASSNANRETRLPEGRFV
jgi:hypothetical protein